MKKRAFLKGSIAAAAAIAASPAVAQQRSGPSYNWKMATAWPGKPSPSAWRSSPAGA
jgi:TRAP-type mannitol/chloroaromatic compound transport system substrate-binding protein